MGKVFLVGAGPGDAELLTLKASRLLQRADVVLHDALVSGEILALIPPTAQLIDVGKRCGSKLLSQEDINGLLVSFGARYETVIRLKGGDPSIFGRSGEEIQALVEAGIPYEVVPGITTATAAAAAAGISLTDRRYASNVLFTTAHRKPGADKVHWKKMVSSGCTLVIYMPGPDYGELAQHLVSAGMSADTPCLVISSVSLPEQKMLRTCLALLAGRASLPAPAILVIGKTVSPDSETQLGNTMPVTQNAVFEASKQIERIPSRGEL